MKPLDKKSEAKLNMYLTVRSVCETNTTIIAMKTALQNAYNEFKSLIPLIENEAQRGGKVITGIAAAKTGADTNLRQMAATVAGLIYAYAAKTKNLELKQRVNFSATDLRDLKDAELAPQVQNIHDAGVENQTALADYDVTTAKLAELQTAINAYKAQIPDPRAAIADRAASKAALKQLFKNADAVLVEQMDKLVPDLAAEHPGFVKAYRSARVIVDAPSKPKKPKVPPPTA